MLSDAALLAGDETGTTLTGIDLLSSPGEMTWLNPKYKHGPKILLEENFSLITQPGDRLRLPEMVHMIPGFAEAPGKTLAQGKEMEGSLDLLLLFLWESVDLQQEDTVGEILLRRQRLSCYGVSLVTWQPKHRPLISKRSAFTPHMGTQTIAKASLVPSDVMALFFFCFSLFRCFPPLSSACAIVLSLEDRLKKRQSRTELYRLTE